MTDRKSHTPFRLRRLVPKSTTLDDLEGRYALYCRIDAYFGAHHENLNEDRPILSAARMKANDSSFWRYKVYADIRGGSLGRGVKGQWGCRKRQFSAFSRDISSETLEMRPALLLCDKKSIVCFSLIPKCMTLNDLEWLFRVKFCFRAGLAFSDRATFET